MKKVLLLFLLVFFFKPSSEHPIHYNTYNNALIAVEKQQVNNSVPPAFEIDTNKYLGIKYVWGGNTMKGLDCSSLIQNVFLDNNINIPRTTKYQSKKGETINFQNIERGDLLFFTKKYDLNTIGHVAIYLGDDRIFHATSKGVIINLIGSNVWNNYWEKRLKVIKRISPILT